MKIQKKLVVSNRVISNCKHRNERIPYRKLHQKITVWYILSRTTFAVSKEKIKLKTETFISSKVIKFYFSYPLKRTIKSFKELEKDTSILQLLIV